MKVFLFLCFFLMVVAPQVLWTAEKAPAVKESCAALCPVCSHYKDGSCKEVKVGGSTPQAEYAGKTYYFCSPSCKKSFLRKPKKFVKAGP